MNNTNEIAKPLDLSFLEKMSGNSPKFILNMIDLFISQMPVLLSTVEEAMSQKDLDKIASTVHKMKTSFTYFGRADITERLKTIEQQALDRMDIETLSLCLEDVKVPIGLLTAQLYDYKRSFQF
ncbi:Hpt domain-containing protein [Pedobacter psychrotolerans]|jgi:HPt (histidine-containing phosphotransfer) domain-containing protein|uniref:Hpt domain-containing protein n=1 Tax=Pedobacter psychrotolerans TaxID=1843235 RepID=UPI003F9772E7